jgi:hypothetical protein
MPNEKGKFALNRLNLFNPEAVAQKEKAPDGAFSD